MTDQLPRYGELATPEEQRRAAGLPPVEQVAEPDAPQPDAAPSARRRPVDRLVTIALLAYGLVSVVSTGLSYLDLPTVMNESMRILGVDGEFTNFAQGKLWGTVAAIVLAVGWSLTAVLSLRRLRSGRVAWWVPLVGAAATMLVVSLCIAVPMIGDPAFIAHVDGTVGG